MPSNDFSKLLGGQGDVPSSKAALSGYNAQANPTARQYTGASINLPSSNGMQQLGKGLEQATNSGAALVQHLNQEDYLKRAMEYEQDQKMAGAEASKASATYHQLVNEALPAYDRDYNGDVKSYVDSGKRLMKQQYDQVYNSLTSDDAKRLFQESSHSVTLGGFNHLDTRYFTRRDAEISANVTDADAGITAAMLSDPGFGKAPALGYAQALQKKIDLANGSGWAEEKKLEYISQAKAELSASVFAGLGALDPKTGSGARTGLKMLNDGNVLGLPGDKQAAMKAHLQGIIQSAETHQAGLLYGTLKGQADGALSNIMGGRMAVGQVKTLNAQLNSLIQSGGATPEQQQWALRTMHAMDFALLAKDLKPQDKITFTRLAETFNPKSDTFMGGDPEAATLVYNELMGRQSSFQKFAQDGMNADGTAMNLEQRNAAGIGPKLTDTEVNNWTVAAMEANKGPDVAKNMMAFYQKFSDYYGGDQRMVVAGFQQLYKNEALHINKQRLLALQAGAAMQNPEVARHLVNISGETLSKLQDGWNPKMNDAAGRPMNPTEFNKLVANNDAIRNTVNNPAAGLLPEQQNDMRDLVTKLAADYVNQNMTQEAAVKQAVDDVIKLNVSGTKAISKSYDQKFVDSRLNDLRYNASTKTEISNPVRVQMYAAMDQGVAPAAMVKALIPKPTAGGYGAITPGSITLGSPIGPRWGRSHNGIDVPMNTGTPLIAPMDAKVKFAGYEPGGFGNTVILEMPDGTTLRYGHLSQVHAVSGQQLGRGDAVGLSGNTGRSTGPHVHVEWRGAGGEVKDPSAWLKKPQGPTSQGSTLHSTAQLMQYYTASGADSLKHPQAQIMQTGAAVTLGANAAQKLMQQNAALLRGIDRQPVGSEAAQIALNKYSEAVHNAISYLSPNQQQAARMMFDKFGNLAKHPDTSGLKVLGPGQRVNAENQLKLFSQYGSWMTDPNAPGESVMAVYNYGGKTHYLKNINGEPIVVHLKDLQGYQGQRYVNRLPAKFRPENAGAGIPGMGL